MKRAILTWHSGFTLIEMMVVVTLIGILMLIGIPQYLKSVEAAKADDAAALLKIIGTTNRMYNLDNTAFASGSINDSCSSTSATACADNSPPAVTPGKGCALIYCRYIATQSWTSKSYLFQALDANAAVPASPCGLASPGDTAPVAPVNYVACTRRKNKTDQSDVGTANGSTYDGWGYTIDSGGKVIAWGGAPHESS